MSKKDIRKALIKEEIDELSDQQLSLLYAKTTFLKEVQELDRRIKKIEEKIQKLNQKL